MVGCNHGFAFPRVQSRPTFLCFPPFLELPPLLESPYLATIPSSIPDTTLNPRHHHRFQTIPGSRHYPRFQTLSPVPDTTLDSRHWFQTPSPVHYHRPPIPDTLNSRCPPVQTPQSNMCERLIDELDHSYARLSVA